MNELFNSIESAYNLPSGMLDRIWSIESSRGKEMLSPKGAEGHFGFMPQTAKEVGLNNPYDLRESAEAAGKYLSKLYRRFKGDWEKTIAAWNWGPSNVQKKGLAKAPLETRNYLKKVADVLIPSASADELPSTAMPSAAQLKSMGYEPVESAKEPAAPSADQLKALGYAPVEEPAAPSKTDTAPATAPVQQKTAATPPASRSQQAADILESASKMNPINMGAALVGKGAEGYNKLVGKAAELATVGATKLGAPPEVAGIAGAAVETAGAFPPIGGGAAIGAKAAPAIERGAERVMQSAVKPVMSQLKKGQASRAIKTMLEEGVNATKGGMEKLRGMVGKLEDEVNTILEKSPSTVNKHEVAKYLDKTINEFKNQVNSTSDEAKIQKAYDEFINKDLFRGSDEIPAKTAHELKKGTYKQLEGKYGEMSSAEVEAQKSLARGLRSEVAKAEPAVTAPLAREADLWNALSVSERRTLMEANNNLAGIGILAHNPSMFAAYLADKSSLFKSLLARALYRNRVALPKSAGAALGAAGYSATKAPSYTIPDYEEANKNGEQQ